MLHIKKSKFLWGRTVCWAGVLFYLCFCWTFSANCAEHLYKDSKNSSLDSQKLYSKVFTSLTAFRIQALKNDSFNSKIITKLAQYRLLQLQNMLPSEYRSIAFKDFFSTALIISGKQSDIDGVCGFYSPFADVVMLFKMDNIDEISKIENVCIVPGEVFRGGKIGLGNLPETMLPLNEDFATTLLKSTVKTEKILSEAEDCSVLFDNFLKSEQDNFKFVERTLIARCVWAFKLKEKKYASNLDMLKNIQLLLRSNSPNVFNGKLKGKASEIMAENYEKFPLYVKRNMTACFCLIMKDGMLSAFVNPIYPRFVVIVIVREDNVDKFKMSLELIDFGQAEKLLKLYKRCNHVEIKK